MNILKIELASIEQTDLGFEHWVDVTYQVPILKNEYTVKLLLLFDFESTFGEIAWILNPTFPEQTNDIQAESIILNLYL